PSEATTGLEAHAQRVEGLACRRRAAPRGIPRRVERKREALRLAELRAELRAELADFIFANTVSLLSVIPTIPEDIWLQILEGKIGWVRFQGMESMQTPKLGYLRWARRREVVISLENIKPQSLLDILKMESWSILEFQQLYSSAAPETLFSILRVAETLPRIGTLKRARCADSELRLAKLKYGLA
ncbi:hypothetical protein B0H16DRAFT_1484389, partial [Mycena metata]